MRLEEHAAQTYPNECCGLIVDGAYWPCRNVSKVPGEEFVIHPEDWASAEDSGRIEAICHSHPDGPSAPSRFDQREIEKSKLPWLILGTDGIRREVSRRALNTLVGRTYEYGVRDCLSLFRDYYRLAHGIDLPAFDHGEWGWWSKGGDLITEGVHPAGFYDIPAQALRPGDAILMQIRSRVPNHCAVLVEDGIILHHLHERLSTRDVFGGYFKKMAVRYLRNDRCLPK